MKNKKPVWQRVIDPGVIDLIKLSHSINRWILPAEIGKNVLEALRPFINIIYSAKILDGLLAHKSAESLMKTVFWMVGLNLAAALLVILLDWLRNSYLDTELFFKKKFSEHALKLDYERLEQTEVQNMIRMDSEMIRFHGGIMNFIRSVGNAAKYIVSIFYAVVLTVPFFATGTVLGKGMTASILTSPLSSIVVIAAMVISIRASLMFLKKGENTMKEFWDVALKGNRHFNYWGNMLVDYKNGKDIRSSNLSPLILKGMVYLRGFFMDFGKTMTRSRTKTDGAIVIVSQATVALFYILVGIKALFGAITVGSILKYVSALVAFQDAFIALLNELSGLNMFATYIKCDIEFFGIENNKYEGKIPVEKRSDNEYELEFRDVSFAYPGTDKLILDHVSFKFKVGQKLALVGKNGTGKTTFIKLLCRLYDPTDGQILLNGIDIKKYDYQEYQSLFSVVFQDFKLFSFELGQNVAADVDYDDARVWDSLEKSGVAGRVKNMKHGLQTVLYQAGDNGVEVSGGEAQKIAIARALYKDAPIIVLDEPTSALDPISEYEIYSKFDTLVSDKTAIYISHRMSSCRFCDNIAVFDSGTVREMGSHESLMARQGLYYQMWEAQAKYYQEEQTMAVEF